MARYAFDARTADGAAIHGVELAADELDLDRRLAESDLLLVKARRLGERRRSSPSNRDLIDFCYHLALVLEAGIPLLEGLRDLADSEHSMHATIGDVARKIEAGSSLSEALGDDPQQFPELLRGLVRAGEESGALDRVLRDLVVYLEWRETLERQVKGATRYPLLVLAGISALIALLAGWVLPRFLSIFSELGAALPPTTRAMLAMHGFVSAWWPVLVGGAVAAWIGCVLALRRETVRRRVDRLILRLPVLGSLALMIEMSRFAHNLGLLLSCGMPMLRSLEMVEGVVQNRVVRETIERAREQVMHGATLTGALGRSDLVPSLVMRMLAVGESSGVLDESLDRVAVYYDREVPAIVDRSVALFNTGALLLLGATLVTIALSIFAPLYQMMGSLNAQ